MEQLELKQRQKELKPLIESLKADKKLPHFEKSYNLWQLLQDGILPYSGGWLEQPAWYTEDMDYISLLYEYESLPVKITANAKRISEMAKSNG